ncbi:MAG: glycosyltransferase, partial [Lachnospiraceae bacterium]|nr:glycosyltransferase [Lachnospiraceae bacterium]
MEPFFSIIIVCLNPGDKLKSTLESVENQNFHNFEVIIKDGLSGDGSLSYAYELQRAWEKEQNRGKLTVICRKDAGIYDAMNQAAKEAKGKYVYFLNCGDEFASETVLEEMAEFISGREGVFYGDIRERQTGQRVASNPNIDAFACYRNVPCHQACFYSRELLLAHPFETKYKVRADYEQFLWCVFENGGRTGGQESTGFFYNNMVIADYEGGGFSETGENRRLSAKEHREITGKYMSAGQLFKFRLIMLLTLSHLRTYLAENERTAGIYNRVKGM